MCFWGILEAIDLHINKIVKDSSLSPAHGYDDFCKKTKYYYQPKILCFNNKMNLQKIIYLLN